MPTKTLRLILGDQLNHSHSWFKTKHPSVTYVLMEVRSETDYATHHIQKVLAFFEAMKRFAAHLKAKQHKVLYIRLNDPENKQSISANCSHLLKTHGFDAFEYQLPDEYRLDKELKDFCATLKIPSMAWDTEHFYGTRDELARCFEGKTIFLMESFYRHMRKKHRVLMDANLQPLTGKWNYDQDNRAKLPKNHHPVTPLLFENDVSETEVELKKAGVKTIGRVQSKRLLWPVDRDQALQLLDYFVHHCLSLFGTFQDAMANEHWSLYHSRLSFAMNVKLLSPEEVVNTVIDYYHAHTDEVEYHQVEGFVRQIIGWREYMRGIYWLKMPEYKHLNYFGHGNSLPEWYWTGNTKMNCCKQAISQSLDYAYAHHIQRLMITGNFALLAGVHPDEVDRWYLGIYIDALEWVEITNTRGMSQFADGGIVGTKPYVSSASYIHKMSNHCSVCYYDKNKKTGEKACPFNSLYWNFYATHEALLAKNPRIGMMYNVWHKMSRDDQQALLKQANHYLSQLNEL
mgnify:CR=1 FL=1